MNEAQNICQARGPIIGLACAKLKGHTGSHTAANGSFWDDLGGRDLIIDSQLETVRFKTKRGEFSVHITELDTLKISSGAGAVLNVQPNANNSIDVFGTKYTAGRK